jgi:hypothetical protein
VELKAKLNVLEPEIVEAGETEVPRDRAYIINLGQQTSVAMILLAIAFDGAGNNRSKKRKSSETTC